MRTLRTLKALRTPRVTIEKRRFRLETPFYCRYLKANLLAGLDLGGNQLVALAMDVDDLD